jgi:transcriptional regulator with XRE-family HTH domain
MKLRLRKLRTKKGLSLRDLEKKVNIHFTTLGKTETGERELTLEQAIKLADYFNVTLDYLVYRLDYDLSAKEINRILSEIYTKK